VTNLVDAPIGARVVIVAVTEGERQRLARHGIVPGVELKCDQDAPLHGPRIVSIGHRRVSVPRAVAREVSVRDVAALPAGDE
jgi:Fe2+ transport system protein FeoA